MKLFSLLVTNAPKITLDVCFCSQYSEIYADLCSIVANKNEIHNEIRRRINSGNGTYLLFHSESVAIVSTF
jgi:hypothetical protein